MSSRPLEFCNRGLEESWNWESSIGALRVREISDRAKRDALWPEHLQCP